jgi:hypothetical protein
MSVSCIVGIMMIYVIGGDRKQVQEVITSLVADTDLYATSSAIFGARLCSCDEVIEMAASVMPTVSLMIVMSGEICPTAVREIRQARQLRIPVVGCGKRPFPVVVYDRMISQWYDMPVQDIVAARARHISYRLTFTPQS